MRNLIILLLLTVGIACGNPVKVTANPDDHAATSGTLGSAKAENELPNETRDTVNRVDTARR